MSVHVHAAGVHAAGVEVLRLLSRKCVILADTTVQQRLQQQVQQVEQQFRALAAALQLQQQLTGLDPLTSEAKQHAALATGFDPDDYDTQDTHVDQLAADKSSLSPDAERLLQAVFALADALDRSQVAGLSYIARCSEQQLRHHFSRLRSNVRSVVQWAQKRAQTPASHSNPNSSTPGTQLPLPPQHASYVQVPLQHPPVSLPHSASGGGSGSDGQPAAPANTLQGEAMAIRQQQQAALERTQRLLDGSGTISISAAGSFVTAMQQTSSWVARQQQLVAIQGTGAATLLRMVSSKFLDVLESWLLEALQEQQLSFARHVLQVLGALPISLPLLQTSAIMQTVYDVAARGPIAASAMQLLRKWGRLQDLGTLDGLQPLLLGGSRAGRFAVHSAGSAAAGSASTGAAAGASAQPMRQLGGASMSARRSLSAAVKRKVQEMRAAGGFPSTAAAGGAASGDAGEAHPSAPGQPAAATVVSAAKGAPVGAGPANTTSSTAAAAAGSTQQESSSLAASEGTKFKRPTKVVKTAAGATASAAAQRAALVHRQLAGAGATGGVGAAERPGQQQQQQVPQVKTPADLTATQRLYRMQAKQLDQQQLQQACGPGCVATSSQLAQGVAAYNRAVQLWLLARCRRVGAEARGLLRQGQQLQGAAEAQLWLVPPRLALPPDQERQYTTGRESQDVAKHAAAAAEAGSYYKLPADSDSPAEPEAAGDGSSSSSEEPVVAPWHPDEHSLALNLACRAWVAGLKCPDCYHGPLPSAAEVQQYEKAQKAAKAAAQQAETAQNAPPAVAMEQVHVQYNTGAQAQYVVGGWAPEQQQLLQQPHGVVMQMAPGAVAQPGGYIAMQQQPVVQMIYPAGGYVQYAPQYPPAYQ